MLLFPFNSFDSYYFRFMRFYYFYFSCHPNHIYFEVNLHRKHWDLLLSKHAVAVAIIVLNLMRCMLIRTGFIWENVYVLGGLKCYARIDFNDRHSFLIFKKETS